MKQLIFQKKDPFWVYIALVMVMFCSCAKKLDLYPRDQFANDVFWTSEANVNVALTALYRGNIQMQKAAEFSPTDWWSYNGLLFLEFATDNAYDRRGDNSNFNKLTNGTLTANTGDYPSYWSSSYSRISRCNYFLDNIGKAAIGEAIKKRVIAEARFLRATQYLYLSTYFGPVPLVTGVLQPEQANKVTKTPLGDIQAFVAKEFTEAAADLPTAKQLVTAERGRATQQAALAFLGRLYLNQENWQQAALTYKKIMDLNENLIDPDYASLFNGTNESSKEIIFATQYLVDLAPNGMLQHFFPAMSAGWGIFCPLGSLAEAYDFKDGSSFSYSSPQYDPADFGKNRDPRLAATILYNNALFKGAPYISHPDVTSSPDQLTLSKQATRTGFSMRKFAYDGFGGGDLQNSGIDLPIIRYAEVLLSYLEAQLRMGIVGQGLLDETINKVRARASVSMPPVTEQDPAKLLAILKKERRVELALEGTRLWDLYRWNDAVTVLQGKFFGASYPGAKNLRKAPDGATDPNSRWFVTTKNFKAENYPWPVPQAEVNINPNLK